MAEILLDLFMFADLDLDWKHQTICLYLIARAARCGIREKADRSEKPYSQEATGLFLPCFRLVSLLINA
jgi:hypothetical protein